MAKRNIAIEAFRCLLMLLIVLHHAAFHGYWAHDESQILLPVLFTVALMWHVDGFVAISGWFGIKFTWLKFLKVWGVIAFYSMISLVYAALLGDGVSLGNLGISSGWFGGSYLMLMLMAPFLNAAIEGLAKQDKRTALTAWGLFAIGIALNWAPRQLFSGVIPAGAGPFSLLTMVFVYVTARMVNVCGWAEFFTKRRCLYAVFIYVGGAFLFSGIPAIVKGGHMSGEAWIKFTSYDSPYVWLLAIAIMLYFFKFVRLPERVGKIFAFLAPSMFGVFLLHHTTGFGPLIYCIPQKWLATRTTLSPVIIVLITGVCTFAICLAADLMRRVGVWGLLRIFRRVVNHG